MKTMHKRRIFKKKPKTLSQKVNRLTRIVKRNVPEVKYTDASDVGQQFYYDFLTSYLVSPLSNISQGTADVNQRIGDKIRVLSQVCKFTLRNQLFAPMNVRLVCFQLLNNPDGTITKASVGNLYIASSYMGGYNAINAPQDYDNRKAFKKLYDKTFCLNPATGTSGAPIQYTKEVHVNLNKIGAIQYVGAGTAISKGEIFWAFITDTTNSASQICSYVIRTFYTDS